MLISDFECGCQFSMCSFFFFKQKTAYEMRISDWSSDVCSSDLIDDPAELEDVLLADVELVADADAGLAGQLGGRQLLVAGKEDRVAVLQVGDRKSVV